MRRVILIVLDSMGVGELPDAAEYGDKGANTLGHIAGLTESFDVPNLRRLGLANIKGITLGGKTPQCTAIGAYGKMKEISTGKDTITGHWEIAGIETTTPFKTYPEGFPAEFIEKFQEEIGVECIGNYPASGTEIIDKLGPLHEETGKPIVYTSADSVFQIAANTDVISLARLYEICETARKLLVGRWACGRVIARPYNVEGGKRIRTPDRKDYAVTPPAETVLDKVKASGQVVYTIGKISDIFNGRGVSKSVHTDSNNDGVDKTIEALRESFDGLIFTNLVDFDSKFGHRRDPEGYGRSIMEFDNRLPEIMEVMKEGDLLMLCADHGNDPVHSGWDHTREYVPLLIWGKDVKGGTDLGVRETFADIGASVAEYLGVEATSIGESFIAEIL